MADVIDALVGVLPGSRLDALRAKRPVARADAQATYDGLITSPSDLTRASATERGAIGYWVAGLAGSTSLEAHYADLLGGLDAVVRASVAGALPAARTSGPYGSYPPGPLSAEDEDGPHWTAPPELRAAIGDRLAAALEHAHLLTYRPRDASPAALQALLDAGWTTDGVVTVSQLVAFTHFQLRVVAGLAILEEAD